MENINAFNLNDDLVQDNDYDGVGDLDMGLIKDSRPMVDSIQHLTCHLFLKAL
jgi:hypothetical protein